MTAYPKTIVHGVHCAYCCLCRLAVLAVSLSALLFCTAGCARQTAESAPAENPRDVLRKIDPSPMRLSSEAQLLYYTLLLADGLADNSATVVSASLQRLTKLDPSASMYGTAAAILLTRGDVKGAQKIASEGLDRYPDDSRLVLLLTGAYAETGQTPKAVALLEAYSKKHPNDSPEITEALVRLFLETGQDDKASALLSTLPRTDNTPEADLARASLLITMGRTAEAKKLLDALLKKDPKFYEAWLDLGFIAERDKDIKGALMAYGKAAELMPDNDEIIMRLASLHMLLKEPDKAERLLEKARPSAVLYLQAAARFFENGYTNHADRMLNLASANGGQADEINIIRSLVLLKQSKSPEKALAPLAEVPATSPLYSSVLLQKAQIFLDADEFDQLVAVAEEGRKLFPDVIEFTKLASYGLVRTHKYSQALTLLKESLNTFPDDEGLLYSLGMVLDESGDRKEAMAVMEKIIRINPKNYQGLNYVGYSLAEQNKDLNRALELVTAALEQSPDSDYIVDSLAWVQYRLGRYEDAWKSIRRCIELGGDEAAIWEHYGDIALAVGNKEEARKGYSTALERKPEKPDVIKGKLDKLR